MQALRTIQMMQDAAGVNVTVYTDGFFEKVRLGAARSASEVVPMLMRWIGPQSVVDVGCGTGSWLAAFLDAGVPDVLGVDGAWAATAHALRPDQFSAHDLTQPLALDRRFDLCLSLEVAEHLPATAAAPFVNTLTALSPIVLFSAAIPTQGGTEHVNEQWPDFWEALFAQRGYRLIDAVRPRIWNNPNCDWWYAQNTFLYAEAHRADALAARIGPASLPLRCVHPAPYLDRAQSMMNPRTLLKMAPRAVFGALRRAIGH